MNMVLRGRNCLPNEALAAWLVVQVFIKFFQPKKRNRVLSFGGEDKIRKIFV
jgi:hypothetical protein